MAIEGLGAMPKMGRMGHQLSLAELHGIIKAQILIAFKAMPEVIPPSSWKKEVLNKGRANKNEIVREFSSQGINLGSQDEYDAYGVAKCLLKRKIGLLNITEDGIEARN
jgi:Holliday junction resolvasome RuvABC endonuclease subunit